MGHDLLVLTDARMLGHDAGPGHVERPARLESIIAGLGSCSPSVRIVESGAPVDRTWVDAVHEPGYVDTLASLAGRSARLDPDTAVSPRSWEAATIAAGLAVSAVEHALAGDPSRAFAVVRPPGHHAESGRAMGFCLLNNVAIAAARALDDPSCERVLIVDWDVHHGNGTQHVFEERGDVLFFSIHQHPLYPGTGLLGETGRGPGAGTTVNAPIPAGCGDREYVRLVTELLAPAARRFRPDLVLVSAGFDAHADDPLGGMLVTTGGFGALAGLVASLADDLCGGRLVLCLEGGYDLDALAASVTTVAEVLAGGDAPAPVSSASGREERAIDAILEFHGAAGGSGRP